MNIKIWWPILFVCTIIVACVLIFPSDLRLADLLSDAGKFDEAIEKYHEILVQFPHRDDLRIRLSKLYLLKNEPEKAMQEIDKVDPAFDFDLNLLQQLADVFAGLQDKERTVRILEKMLTKKPDDLALKIRLAEAYQWNQQNTEAIALYDNIWRQQPEDELLEKLVALTLAEKQYTACVGYLRAKLDRSPNDLGARTLLGEVLLADNRRHDAALEFERVLKHDRNNRALREKLAELYLWMNEVDNGRHHYEYLVRTHPENRSYFDKFIELTEQRDPERALKYYRQRLQQFPQNAALRKQFINYAVEMGFVEDAVTQSELLVQQHPGNAEYLQDLAYLYKDVHEPQKAQRVFERLLGQKNYAADAFHELKIYYEEEKQTAQLLELFTKADRMNLLDTGSRKQFIDVLLATRRYKTAIDQCTALLRTSPQEWDVRIKLAGLYLLQDDPARASRIVKTGLQVSGDQERFLLYAAHFFEQQKNTQESIASLQKLVRLRPAIVRYKRLLADQYVKTRKFARAEHLYREILKTEPGNIDRQLEYASLFWLQGDFQRMQTVVKHIQIPQTESSVSHRKIGQFYFSKGFYNEAIEQFSIVLRSVPEDSLSLRMSGLAHAWNNQPEIARVILARFHARYTPDLITLFQEAQLLYQSGQKTAAKDRLQRVLTLAELQDDREAGLIKVKALALLGQRRKALAAFEALKRAYPSDSELDIDFAEALMELHDYASAETRLTTVLEKHPENYRARRLLSYAAFEQGKYKEAARELEQLADIYPQDTRLLLDLSDSQLATGDWLSSTRTLKMLLQRFPKNSPAQVRLSQLRREQSERFASEYLYEKQTDDIFRQMFRAVVTKAVSWVAFTFSAGRELFNTDDPALDDQTYSSAALRATTSFRSKLQASVSGKVQENSGDLFGSPSARIHWQFNQGNSISLSGTLNDLWFDPFQAALFQGRVDRLQTDLSLFLYKRIVMWSRFTYEQHDIRKNERLGQAYRTNVQVGYQWATNPNLLTFYQLYNLDYSFNSPAGPAIISIPEDDTIHYFGAAFSRQMTPRLYTHFSGSVGYNTVQNSAAYYGALDLEYLLLNRLRFKTQFSYGNENRLNRSENTLRLLFDISYFY